MKKRSEPALSRREREIMDAVYLLGRATGVEIQQRLSGNPSYSTVRTLLRALERKGHLRHVEEGQRYVYMPSVTREAASKNALQRLISIFFDGSAKAAVAALIDPKAWQLGEKDLEELESMIRDARKGKNA